MSLDSRFTTKSFDFWAELNKIRAKRHKAEWELQVEFVRLINRFGDAHSAYTHSCFIGSPNNDPVYYYQPFRTTVAVIAGQQRIFVRGLYSPTLQNPILGGEDLQRTAFRLAVIDKVKSSAKAVRVLQKAGSFEPLIGAELVALNGKPAVQFFWEYALSTSQGQFKDRQINFDYLVGYPFRPDRKVAVGQWFSRGAAHVPETDAATYRFKLPNNGGDLYITVPWLVDGFFYQGSPRYASPAEYYSICRSTYVSGRAGAREKPRYFKLVPEAPIDDNTGGAPDLKPNTQSSGGSDVRWYWEKTYDENGWTTTDDLFVATIAKGVPGKTVEQRVGVLFFPNAMEPFNSDMKPFVDRFVPAFRWLKKTVEEKNEFKLILDWTDNGGGYPCFGLAIQHFLLPKGRAQPPILDIRQSTYFFQAQDIIKTFNQTRWSLWEFGTYGNLAYSFNYSANSIMQASNAFLLKRNQKKLPWTSRTFSVTDKVTYGCDPELSNTAIDEAWFGKKPVPITEEYLKPKVKPENILMLGTGYCGSTCAVTARAFKQLGVRSVVHGGVLGQPRKVSESFPGGFVTNARRLFKAFDKTLLIFPDDQANAYFVPVEALSYHDGEIPMEVIYEQADYGFHYEAKSTNLTEIEAGQSFETLWGKAAEFF